MSEIEKTCENCEYELEDPEGTHCRHCIHNAEEYFKQKPIYTKIESLDEVIERLQYKADNIKAKLEPSYFTECIEYLKIIIPCYLGSPCEYQTEDVNYNHGWVACSERLPEPDVDVLVTVKIRDIYSAIKKEDRYKIETASYYELDNDWLFDNEYYSYALEDYEVIAWRPLPSPYEQAEKMKGE